MKQVSPQDILRRGDAVDERWHEVVQALWGNESTTPIDIGIPGEI